MKECLNCGTLNSGSDRECRICHGSRFSRGHPHGEPISGEILEVGLRMTVYELGALVLFWGALAAMFYHALGMEISAVTISQATAWLHGLLPGDRALLHAPALGAGVFVVTGLLFVSLSLYSRRRPMSLLGLRRLRKLAYSTILVVTAGLLSGMILGWSTGRTGAGVPFLLGAAMVSLLPALFVLVFCHSLARVRCPHCGDLMKIGRLRTSGDMNLIGLDQEFHGRRHHCDRCRVGYTLGYFSSRWI